MASNKNAVEQQIKAAIDTDSPALIRAWVDDFFATIDAKIISGSIAKKLPVAPTSSVVFDDYAPVVHSAEPNLDRKSSILHSETPLQYAGRNGKIKAAKALIAAGAKVTADLNEHTRAFVTDTDKFERDLQPKGGASQAKREERRVDSRISGKTSAPVHSKPRVEELSPEEAAQQLFTEILVFCEDINSLTRFALLRRKTELRSSFDSLKEAIGKFIAQGENRGYQLEIRGALWAEMQCFIQELFSKDGSITPKVACSGFLARVALLPSPLRKVQDKLTSLISRVGSEGKKAELIELREGIEQRIQQGTVPDPYALGIVEAQLDLYLAAPNAANLPDTAYWIDILKLSPAATATLIQLQEFDCSKIGTAQLRNLSILRAAFFAEISQEIKDGKIQSSLPEYQALLIALHQLLQCSPELSREQMEDAIGSIESKSGSLVDRMEAITTEITALAGPTQKVPNKIEQSASGSSRPVVVGTPEKSFGKVHTIGTPPEERRVTSSYNADPSKLAPWNPKQKPIDRSYNHTPGKLSKPPVAANSQNGINRTGKKWKRLPADDSDVGVKNPRTFRPKKPERADALDLAVPNRGTTDDPLGWNLLRNRMNAYSSFYYAMKRVYDRLQKKEGYEYFSIPEMKLFKKAKELLENKEQLKRLVIDRRTVWETLNPDSGFKIIDLIEPDGKSVLDQAIKQHTEDYFNHFKTALSQEGGTYSPKDKNYYFEKKDGRYHLMVKAGKTLSAAEKEAGIRELLIITRDMEDQIDVNFRLHTAVSAEEAQDLAVIITVLGATVDDPTKVAKKDRQAQRALAEPARAMLKTAAAPEFSKKSPTEAASERKPESLWATVRKRDLAKDLGADKTVQDAITANQYRLMSSEGLRSLPAKKDITDPLELKYWTKKTELCQRPDWADIDASDIITSVLRGVDSVKTEDDVTDGIFVHLTSFEQGSLDDFSKETLTRSQTWSQQSSDSKSNDPSANPVSSNVDSVPVVSTLPLPPPPSSRASEPRNGSNGQCAERPRNFVRELNDVFDRINQKGKGVPETPVSQNESGFFGGSSGSGYKPNDKSEDKGVPPVKLTTNNSGR